MSPVTHEQSRREAAHYRKALLEIASPPDASKGDGYGCLDLHEARYIAREALEGRDVQPPSAQDRRPADIVFDGEDRVTALLTFVAQELEHWGFSVADHTENDYLIVGRGQISESLSLRIATPDERIYEEGAT